MTMVVFSFDPGGFIREHVVPDGAISVHVLEGELTVKTSEKEHRLGQNSVLLLAPGVKHDVAAA